VILSDIFFIVLKCLLPRLALSVGSMDRRKDFELPFPTQVQ
jgi:hypothetical protein